MATNPINRIVAAYEREIMTVLNGSSSAFTKSAFEIARRMVSRVSVLNAHSWRQAARKATRGRRIYESLQTELQGRVGQAVRLQIDENAHLISSLPEELRIEVARYAAEQYARGARSDVVENYLRKRFPEMARNRVRLIARTQTSKASTSIVRARAENIGAHWYEWSTSEDQRVRTSHRKMDKVLCSFDDPPSPEALAGEKPVGRYGPGEIFNCRCTPLPLIDLDEVSWPHRVYRGGSIQRMTRAAFIRVAGMPLAA